MKRRPFFLLEVLIATILVGLFAHLLIHGAFKVVIQEREMLQKLVQARNDDKIRMDLVVRYWKDIEPIPKEKPRKENGYAIWCLEAKKDELYLLNLKGSGKTYKFYVEKHR
jgi:hypothetical protein